MPRDRFVVGMPLGRWQTNCYVVGDRDLAAAAVVDPGETAEVAVAELLRRAGVRCEAILLTHGHLDHLWGVPALAEVLDVPVFLHPDDRWLWHDPVSAFVEGLPPGAAEEFLGGPWRPPTERLEDLRDGQRLTFAGVTFEAAHTPGHTPGHMTFLAAGIADADVVLGRELSVDEAGILFSGDLLFAGSVGRTDFPRGSWEQQMQSLGRTVLPLEDDVLVLSGHGPETTVGRERRTNPFLAEVVRGR
ncbi:MAG TPA: MBL fold metallo-hydrolase [Nitriliruptorales bacterium]|nr:MBL fold metallo-hydrolase [Nitriliruptorales bacterium]